MKRSKEPAAVYGATAHVLVTCESLVVTISRGEQFRTKAGIHIPAPNVNMGAIDATESILLDIESGKLDCQEAAAHLERGNTVP